MSLSRALSLSLSRFRSVSRSLTLSISFYPPLSLSLSLSLSLYHLGGDADSWCIQTGTQVTAKMKGEGGHAPHIAHATHNVVVGGVCDVGRVPPLAFHFGREP